MLIACLLSMKTSNFIYFYFYFLRKLHFRKVALNPEKCSKLFAQKVFSAQNIHGEGT